MTFTKSSWVINHDRQITVIILLAGCVSSLILSEATADSNETEPETTYNLELVQAVWRHGNRSPAFFYPMLLSEYMHDFDPFEFGMLTPSGRQQSVYLGDFLRERYSDFLPPYYTYDSARLVCCQARRTQETSLITSAAIWPPTGPQQWQEEGLGTMWTPVPCEYVPVIEDVIYQPYGVFCPRFIELILGIVNSPEFLLQEKKITEDGVVNQYVALFTHGLVPVTYIDLVMVYDSFMARQGSGFKLPEWAGRVFPNPLQEMYALYLSLFIYNRELTQMSLGNFLKEILDTASQLEQGTLIPPKRVFVGYSMHDLQISAFLKIFKLVPEESRPTPTFGSVFIFEWYRNENTSKVGVKLVYRNTTFGDAMTLTIPGCDEICPLDQFRRAAKDAIPITPRSEYCKLLGQSPLTKQQIDQFLNLTRLWLDHDGISAYREKAYEYIREQSSVATKR